MLIKYLPIKCLYVVLIAESIFFLILLKHPKCKTYEKWSCSVRESGGSPAPPHTLCLQLDKPVILENGNNHIHVFYPKTTTH